MTQPPTLDYRSPLQDSKGRVRLKAVRYVRGNGVGSILIGAGCGGMFGIVFSPALSEVSLRNPMLSLAIGLMALYHLTFLVCGILYTIAHQKIRQPNSSWERFVMITAWVHIGVIGLATMLSLIVFSLETIIVFLLASLINGAAIISLFQMIRQVKRAQAEIV